MICNPEVVICVFEMRIGCIFHTGSLPCRVQPDKYDTAEKSGVAKRIINPDEQGITGIVNPLLNASGLFRYAPCSA
jgi:hypothetical protein